MRRRQSSNGWAQKTAQNLALHPLNGQHHPRHGLKPRGYPHNFSVR